MRSPVRASILPDSERSYGAGGGGRGTFIVHTNRWRLPRAGAVNPARPRRLPEGRFERLRCLVLAPGGEHEAAAIHHASRRRGGSVAVIDGKAERTPNACASQWRRHPAWRRGRQRPDGPRLGIVALLDRRIERVHVWYQTQRSPGALTLRIVGRRSVAVQRRDRTIWLPSVARHNPFGYNLARIVLAKRSNRFAA
jgi:hypothetical protein